MKKAFTAKDAAQSQAVIKSTICSDCIGFEWDLDALLA